MYHQVLKDIDGSYLIFGLPMPPPENNLYVNSRNGRFKSKELAAYQQHSDYFHLQEKRALSTLATEIRDQWIPGSKLIEIERYYFFPEEKVFTKDKRPQRMDASNRNKALDDAIATMLEIDDKYFFRGTEEKIATDSMELKNTAAVRLRAFSHGSLKGFPDSFNPYRNGRLILTRKLGEGISFADGMIQVGVHELRSNRVSITVSAPRGIKIERT